MDRRVLGEVQLPEKRHLEEGGDHDSHSILKRRNAKSDKDKPSRDKDKPLPLSLPSRKSESIKDQISLKEQVNTTTQQLLKQDQKIEDLKKRHVHKTKMMNKLESEKGKLLGDLKQLSLEKEQLSTLLEEELQVRKQIQLESQKLVSDIRVSYEGKISKLRDELRMKEEVVGIKQDLIREMEGLVQQLRQEIHSMNSELQEVRSKEREAQGKMSQSFRGSISMMQSQLSRKSLELESQIKILESKHASDAMSKSREFESQRESLMKTLSERTEELEEVRGRLEESREAREATLQEMNASRKKYAKSIKELEKKLEESREQIEQLQSGQGESEQLGMQVGILEAQLEQTMKMNDDLTHKLGMFGEQQQERKTRVLELEDTVAKLQKSLEDVQHQKEELYSQTQELLRKRKSLEKVKADSSAVILLKQQLTESQERHDETKESLMSERQKLKEVGEQLGEIEKSFGLSKVDVRILTREKTALEAQIERKKEETKKAQEELEVAKTSNLEMEKRFQEMEKLCEELKAKSTDDEFDLIHTKEVLQETKEDKQRLEENLKELKMEMGKMEETLRGYENVKKRLEERDTILQEKENQLKEKDRKIDSLQTNVSILREASSVLDTQLKEFEGIFNSKLEELEKSEYARAELLGECSSLKESVQKTKISLNETLSLKSFIEKRLEEVERQLLKSEECKREGIELLSVQVDQLKEKNAELVQTTNKMAAELENMAGEKSHFEERCERVNADNTKYINEVHHYLQLIVNFKDNEMKLKEGLQQAVIKAESYKTQLETMSDELKAIKLEKSDSDIQLQSTISQQAKLIEYLQSQNEVLKSKKKDKKFHLFSTPSGNKNPKGHPSTSGPGGETPANKASATPRKLYETPMHVVQPTATPTPKAESSTSTPALGAAGDCFGGAVTFTKCGFEGVDPSEKENSERIRHTLIYEDVSKDKERVDPNCSMFLGEDIYLLGCEQGLFSKRKGQAGLGSKVKIGGVSSVYQMEFISSLQSALFIHGPQRNLVLERMGMLRACAEAAECSQPKLTPCVVSELSNCHMFGVFDGERGDVLVAVSTAKALHLLCWNGKNNSFIPLTKVNTTETITCLLVTPDSVIFGCDKVYELDTKNFQMEPFLDDSDETLYYLKFSCNMMSSFPVAILDVGLSNWTPDRGSYAKEYLMCFSDMGVFVDEYGRRSRPEDIVWSKLPVCVVYRHPNLYVVHFSSVEVIRLNAESYTRERINVNVTEACVGEEVTRIPDSCFIQLPSPNYLGAGGKSASVLLRSLDKHKTQILEVDLDGPTTNVDFKA